MMIHFIIDFYQLQFYFFHAVIRKIREEAEKVSTRIASLVAAVPPLRQLLSPPCVAAHIWHFVIACGLVHQIHLHFPLRHQTRPQTENGIAKKVK